MEYQDILATPQQNTVDNGWVMKFIIMNEMLRYKNVCKVFDKRLYTILWCLQNRYGSQTSGSSEEKHGLRILWAKFYGEEYHPLYEEAVKRLKAKENKRYLSINNQTVFDIENYMKRTLLTVEIILLEANTRAEKQNTTAFLHVVGFGLGKFKVSHLTFKKWSEEIFYLIKIIIIY